MIFPAKWVVSAKASTAGASWESHVSLTHSHLRSLHSQQEWFDISKNWKCGLLVMSVFFHDWCVVGCSAWALCDVRSKLDLWRCTMQTFSRFKAKGRHHQNTPVSLRMCWWSVHTGTIWIVLEIILVEPIYTSTYSSVYHVWCFLQEKRLQMRL